MPEGSQRAEPGGLEAVDFDDSAWRQLDLPHDWGVEGPFRQDLPGRTGKLPWAGIGWYRKSFTLPASDRDQRVFIDFDGAMSDSTIYLNGQRVGGWPYGYTSFRVELTDAIRFGEENVLAVRLDNQPESSRWYPGGGIYRNVWMVKMSPIHIAHRGVFVTTPAVSTAEAEVKIAATIDNQSGESVTLSVKTDICRFDSASGDVAASSDEQTLIVAKHDSATLNLPATVARPKLWSPHTPALYVARTKVFQDGKLIDQQECTFGIRALEFTADRGLLVNGEQIAIRGVCLHHDLGPLGAAVHGQGIQRQIELLQEMGCNAIRTSHNPPAPELLDLCDRMGMLVQVEAFDCWGASKIPNDYGRFFEEWHEKDLVAMVRRDRNHPSVVMWSTGNEIIEQRTSVGTKLSKRLADIVRREDPTRPVTVGCNRPESGFNGFQKTIDVFGYNYKPHLYQKFRRKNPDLPLYSSESASCVSSRGEYFFPVVEDQSGGQGGQFQMSSYDLYAPPWASRPELEFAGQDTVSGVFGEFVWTGFDYLGEPTPYNDDLTNLLNTDDPDLREKMQKELEELGKIRPPSRSSYFGIFDLCGFKKDRFYLYQSRWRPEQPMAHILPHWNWPDRVGKVTPVHVYTSGDEAELFLNGVSLGRKRKNQGEYRLVWDDVRYEPGRLHVVAYKQDAVWAEAQRETTGGAAAVALSADRSVINGDGNHLVYVSARVIDRDGATIPCANNLLHFRVSGPASVLAVGNGDATSHQPFQADEITAYHGMALLICRSESGRQTPITIEATSDGLKADLIEVSITPLKKQSTKITQVATEATTDERQ
jgi:beta-galactosidase